MIAFLTIMTADRLQYPYSWKDRTPCLKDGVFFVPEHFYDHKSCDSPSLPQYFNNNNPVHIEYCSGNGEWIIERAKQYPLINWIAVEMWFPRVQKIYKKKIADHLNNLLIVAGKGGAFSQEYLDKHSLDAVFVNFPDPWPKARHAKHRIIQQQFADQLTRIVKPQGVVTLVTDDLTYHLQMKEVMSQWTLLKNNGNDYGTSFFDRLWRSKGRDIYYLRYAYD